MIEGVACNPSSPTAGNDADPKRGEAPMQIIESVTPEQLRCWKRWLGTLEAMSWMLQISPMRADRASRAINEEDRNLCRYLKELIARGRNLTRGPATNWDLRNFEEGYRAAASWFHELQRERDPDWKL
jgi:hypothetical protein